MILEDYNNTYLKYLGRKDQLVKNLKETEINIKTSSQQMSAIEEVQALAQLTAKETQDTLRYHIEDLVQSALDYCFPNKYDFLVRFDIKRGKTEAKMILEKDGLKVDPMDGTGGGVVDITSFALRLVAWSLSNTDNVLILDEPFKFLSVNLRPLAGEMLSHLSKKLGLQIIMVTHDDEMINVSDAVFKVSQSKGVSTVKIIKE